MADSNLIFFQQLINLPSATPEQKKEICALRKAYSPIKKIEKQAAEPEILRANVAQLLSKFDEGNAYGIILHPVEGDDSAFATQLPLVRQQLLQDINTTPLPRSLKALLCYFVLGKYGRMKHWIGAAGADRQINCASEQVEKLGVHPLNDPETAGAFKEFGYAITADCKVINALLNLIEEQQGIKIERKGLENFRCHTYVYFLYLTLKRLINAIVGAYKKRKISVSCKKSGGECSLLIKHSITTKNVADKAYKQIGRELGVHSNIAPAGMDEYAAMTVSYGDSGFKPFQEAYGDDLKQYLSRVSLATITIKFSFIAAEITAKKEQAEDLEDIKLEVSEFFKNPEAHIKRKIKRRRFYSPISKEDIDLDDELYDELGDIDNDDEPDDELGDFDNDDEPDDELGDFDNDDEPDDELGDFDNDDEPDDESDNPEEDIESISRQIPLSDLNKLRNK